VIFGRKMGIGRWRWEKNREFLGAGLDFWAENAGSGGQEWTRGEIGLSLKNRVKCFLDKGLRW